MARSVKAWLRMHPALATYEIPTSEWSFYNYAHRYLDYVHPLNGGQCSSSGTWTQSSERLETGFAVGLKAFCAANGIGYYPSVEFTDDAAAQAVLNDSPAGTQQTAIDNLVTLATTRGAPTNDGPWDGVEFDLEKPNLAGYKTLYNNFLTAAAAAIHAAGLNVCITVYGNDGDEIPDPGTTYLYGLGDFALYETIADQVNIMCYQYGDVTEFALVTKGYYEWTHRCTEYAIAKGLSASKLYVGIAGMCVYSPVAPEYAADVPYDWLTAYAEEQEHTPVWTELNLLDRGSGVAVCRWKFVELDGSGERAFIMDADTWRKHLEIVDRHGAAGIAMFAPGYEDTNIWSVIEQWKKRPVW